MLDFHYIVSFDYYQMQKKALYFLILFHGLWSYGQDCPVLSNPVNGSNNVPVNTTISWPSVEGVPGYIISLGTTPGGTEIINQQSVGSATTYTPPLGLPDNSQIFVTITLFFFDLPNITCTTESFRTEDVITAPSCTSLRSPINDSVNINVASNLSWGYAQSATGYRLTIGTAAGLGNILPTTDIGNVLSYSPPVDFPFNTQIYVSLIPYNDNGDALSCTEESFTTGLLAVLPTCATLTGLYTDGAINVPLTPLLEWTDVPGAISYRVSIGTAPFINDVLNNAVFFTNSTFVINFESNRTFFITIIPQNAAGEAIGCGQESFSTILGCGPFFDTNGNLVTLNPPIDFPDTISFCQNESPFMITSTDTAEGYRWYRVDQFGNEALISETDEVALIDTGEYRYEAYNIISGSVVECSSTKEFSVVSSEIATITNVNISEMVAGFRISVEVNGIGDYEYALNSINGPYQDSNVFDNVPSGSHTVYVRDKNGCGIAEEKVEQDLTLEGFPKFFTPNGDGVNDFWQFIPPPFASEITLDYIRIFNRYGLFLVQIDPTSRGWDGTFNGKELPASDYWFNARDRNNQVVQGHFSLKR